MNLRIVEIPKRKIKLVFNEKVAKEYLKRVNKLKKYYGLYDRIVPVEKDPHGDFYYLVGAIPRFCALFNDDDVVPCIVEEYTNPKEQLLKVARRFEYQYTTPDAKRDMIDQLKTVSISNDEIIDKTIFDKQKLRKYQYNEDIPHHIRQINEQSENPASRETLNMINRLKSDFPWLNTNILDYLYNRAILKNLSQQQIRAIRTMLDKLWEKFCRLKLKNQIKVIKYVLSSQALLIHLWEKRIDELL